MDMNEGPIIKWNITTPGSNRTLSYEELCKVARAIFIARPQYVEVRTDGLKPYTLNNLLKYFFDNKINVILKTDGSALINLELDVIRGLDNTNLIVNNEEDIKRCVWLFMTGLEYRLDPKHIVVSTQFDRDNMKDLENIKYFGVHYGHLWLPSVTFDKDKLPKTSDIKILTKLENHKILRYDMLQNVHCGAGEKSFGILPTGNVVACVDEFEFNPKVNVYGNLLENTFSQAKKDIKKLENDCKTCIFGKQRHEIFKEDKGCLHHDIPSNMEEFQTRAIQMRNTGDNEAGLLNMINSFAYGQTIGDIDLSSASMTFGNNGSSDLTGHPGGCFDTDLSTVGTNINTEASESVAERLTEGLTEAPF